MELHELLKNQSLASDLTFRVDAEEKKGRTYYGWDGKLKKDLPVMYFHIYVNGNKALTVTSPSAIQKAKRDIAESHVPETIKALTKLKRLGLGPAECEFTPEGLVVSAEKGPYHGKARYVFRGIIPGTPVEDKPEYHPLRKRFAAIRDNNPQLRGDNIRRGKCLTISTHWLLETTLDFPDRCEYSPIENLYSINNWLKRFPNGVAWTAVLPTSIFKTKPLVLAKKETPLIIFRNDGGGNVRIDDHHGNTLHRFQSDTMPDDFEACGFNARYLHAFAKSTKSGQINLDIPVGLDPIVLHDFNNLRALVMPVRLDV